MKKILLLLSLLAAGVQAAPSLDYQVFNAQGQAVSLSEFKGKVVYVDFWASWCGPCRKSFPWMNEIQKKYQDQGLAVVAINLDTDNELAQEFLKQVPANFSVRFNPEGDVARSFDLLGMPSSFMFNRQGQLVQHHVGFYVDKTAEYEQELVNLLKE
ncbi:TlpA family protein disulfide reductase [Shewanella sp. SW36]|uniref:TlpA disulfide reductase family protein n=1 Tax=Shewanella TaxID=22 RepID=UPI0021DAE66D|nr:MULTISPECIES: TlpA disulfide reductase family protein [unclassified Shewanella]MCU7974044.1 TlpA family protein disulfide reductase [Shewanella sp. SW36]MCU7989654.1 TlpA family protein disulfide reductase [Shewanella sp. SW1]MCU8050268.1 TlpA family protein disulfide reductase [Shewanella sp. SM43]